MVEQIQTPFQYIDDSLLKLNRDDRFEMLLSLIKKNTACENIELTNHLIVNHLNFYLSSNYLREVISLIDLVQPLYLKNPAYLAVFYCFKGHLYHFTDDFENAKIFYRLAVSYSTEYEIYHTGASALINLMINTNKNIPVNHAYEISKFIPLYKSSQDDIDIIALFPTFTPHITSAIQLGRYSYVENILHVIEQRANFHPEDRYNIQLKGFQIMNFMVQKRYKEAIPLLNEIISICIHSYTNLDLLRASYLDLVTIYNELGDHFNGELQTEYLDNYLHDHFYISPEQIHYILNTSNMSVTRKKFGLLKIHWIETVNEYINDPSYVDRPFTLLLIDYVKLINDTDIPSIFKTIHANLSAKLTDVIHFSTLYNNSTIAYVIEKKQSDVDILCHNLSQLYNLDKNVFFTSIDIQATNTISIVQGIEIARAHLYYQLLN